jgi:hypothetical protein
MSLRLFSPRSSTATPSGRTFPISERVVSEIEDLAADAGRRDPRGPHDVEPEVPLVADVRLARVETHPDAHLAGLGPRVAAQGALRGDRAGDRVPGARERVEERVALGVDLRAPGVAERLAHDPPVVAGDGGVGLVAELLEKLRRALDVGEREGDRACVLRHGSFVSRGR